jgi:hypothetical protein
MARKGVFGARLSRAATLLLGAGVLFLAAVPVQVTGTGIDLYGLLVVGVLLLVAERTAGDWVANMVGPVGTALIFAVVAAAVIAYLLSDGGRKRVEHSMTIAAAYGYRPVYFVAHRKLDSNEKADERIAREVRTAAPDPAPAPQAASAAASSNELPAPPEPAPPDGARPVPFSFTRAPRELASPRLTADPELAELGDDVTVRFSVAGRPRKMPADVTFFVNGLMLGSAPVGADGRAQVRWHPRVPGQYQLRAEIGVSSLETNIVNTTVQVLPRGR